MELTEVVSPTVAVPVLCVLVCAFLVFAFGFKSPAQPPSFDVFDEDGKKKKAKKSKGSSKGQSNGHAVSAGEGDVNNSAKVQPSPRQTVKQQTSKSQTVITKSKSASQPAQETKKSKKQATKEEDQKSVKKPVIEEDVNDIDGWHTVPKKDKKQKKKENESKQERQDSPVKEEEIVVKSEEPALAATSVNKIEEIPGSPQEQRNKKKKERKNKKTKAEEEVVEQIKVETQVIAEVAPVIVPEPEVIDTNIELQIKDAMETTVNNDEIPVDKKKKSKKDKKKVIEDDFVIPQSAIATKVVTEPVQDLPLKENTDALTVKVAKKKQKKDRNKKNDEKSPESLEIGASGEVESSPLQSSVSNTQPKKTKLKESVKEVPAEIEASIEVGASSDTASPAQPTASFDELGGMTESWTEAKPKSKKKKARRAD